jgi:hypothetical protein
MIVNGKSHPLIVVSCSLSARNASTLFEPRDTEQIFDPIMRSPLAIATSAITLNVEVASPPDEVSVSVNESSNLICDLLGNVPDLLVAIPHEDCHLNVNFSQLIEGRLANVLIDTDAGSSYVSRTFVHEQSLSTFVSHLSAVSGAFGDAVSNDRYCKVMLTLGAYSGNVVFRVAPLLSYDFILERDWISSDAVSTNWDRNKWLLCCANSRKVVFTPRSVLCAPHDLAFILDDMDV